MATNNNQAIPPQPQQIFPNGTAHVDPAMNNYPHNQNQLGAQYAAASSAPTSPFPGCPAGFGLGFPTMMMPTIGYEDPNYMIAQAAYMQVYGSFGMGMYSPGVYPDPFLHGTGGPMALHQHNYGAAKEANRGRVPFTDRQIAALMERYAKDNTIKKDERMKLGEEIGLSERQVKIWFQNKRHKLRKEGEMRRARSEDDTASDESHESSQSFTDLNCKVEP
ncbi:unnamed protein product [Caenorhabditis sp. 36 PRJEB53466]|nr:unnamed protein product [Caenorhabditis sp. 36 PRJEB53466]